MRRRKVKLALIRDEAVRKITFKKRKKGFFKKLEELSMLCGIQAFSVVYSPYEPQPTVWASPDGVLQVLARFNHMSAIDKSKKMVNHESFLRQRIEKGIERRKKQWRDNRWKEITQVMSHGLVGHSLSGLNITDLNDLKWVIDDRLSDVLKHEETLLKGNPNPRGNIFINGTNNISEAGGAILAGNTMPMPMPVEDRTMVEVSAPVGVANAGGTTMVVSEPPPPPEAVLQGPLEFGMGDGQQWFMDPVNLQDQLPFGGRSMGGGVNDPFINQNQGGFDWP